MHPPYNGILDIFKQVILLKHVCMTKVFWGKNVEKGVR